MHDKTQTTDTSWSGLSIITAFASSLCCIIPVAAFLAGIGGIASTFSWFEPFRPYLLGLTALVLGVAWYQKLRPQWDPECNCEENPSFIQTKSFLGIVTILTILLATFPYYSNAFFTEKSQQVGHTQKSQVQTINLHIKGMTCSGCEATVENAVVSLQGILKSDASSEKGHAEITYNTTQTNRKSIVSAINQTGFTVVEEQAR